MANTHKMIVKQEQLSAGATAFQCSACGMEISFNNEGNAVSTVVMKDNVPTPPDTIDNWLGTCAKEK